MKLRLMADADLRRAIMTGLKRRNPLIDFAAGAAPDGTLDPEILAIEAAADRVLVSHDVNSMPGHFDVFVGSRQSPGLLLIPQSTSTTDAIERLLAIYDSVEQGDLRGQRWYLPHFPLAE